MNHDGSCKVLASLREETLSAALSAHLHGDNYVFYSVREPLHEVEQDEKDFFDLMIWEWRGSQDELDWLRRLKVKNDRVATIIIAKSDYAVLLLEAVQLPLTAAFTIPVELPRLIDQIEWFRRQLLLSRLATRQRDTLTELADQFQKLQNGLGDTPIEMQGLSLSVYLDLTLRNILSSVFDLRSAFQELADGSRQRTNVCRMLECPRSEKLEEMVGKTIEVLLQTKNSFKSKELYELRLELERAMDHRRAKIKPVEDKVRLK